MATKVKVTLLAATYVRMRQRYSKGWTRLFDEDDPALKRFKDDPRFKVESAAPKPRAKLLPGVRRVQAAEAEEPTPKPVSKPSTPSDSGPSDGGERKPTNELTEVLDEKLVALLPKEVTTIEQVLKLGVDGLQKFDGIGEALSAQIHKACEEATPPDSEPSDEGDEEDD